MAKGAKQRIAAQGSIPESHDEFALHIPEFNIRATATRVWAAGGGQTGHRCGASVSETDTRSGSRWRTFVDALPVESIEPDIGVAHDRFRDPPPNSVSC